MQYEFKHIGDQWFVRVIIANLPSEWVPITSDEMDKLIGDM